MVEKRNLPLDFIVGIRNTILLNIVKAVEHKIDGRQITKQIESMLDEEFGEEISEKLQRGPILNLLFEMAEGLYSENLIDLNCRIEKWQHNIGATIADLYTDGFGDE